MNTQERIVKFKELVAANNHEEIEKFVTDNSDDKRFLSIVDLHSSFRQSITKSLECEQREHGS